MARAASKQQDEGFRIVGLTGLSPKAVRFLRRHPNKAKLAVRVAVETAASQSDDAADGVAVPEALRPFAVARALGGETINASEAAARLKVSRTTVYDWVEKGTLLAWRSTKRGLSIPAEQILGEGRVVEGLDRVVDIVGDPELAWDYLSVEAPFADGPARPIDLLKDGRMAEVLGSAAAFGTAST